MIRSNRNYIHKFTFFVIRFFKLDKDEFIKSRFREFEKLICINNEVKINLRDRMNILFNDIYEAKKKNIKMLFYSLFIYFLLYIIAIVIIIVPLGEFIVYNLFIKQSNLYNLYDNRTLILSIIIGIIAFIIYIPIVESKNIYGLAAIILTFIGIEIYIYLHHWSLEEHYIINIIASALLASILFFPIYFIFFYFKDVVIILVNSKKYSRYPLSTLVDTLIFILLEAERAKDKMILLEYKKEQLQKLEIAAQCIEKYFPLILQSGDIITDSWVHETTRQVSAALREKKKWILTPKDDTNKYFIENIALTLICILNGNWDALERIEVNKPSRADLRHSILIFMLIVLKTILLMGLPILGYWVFEQIPLVIPETVRGYILIGLFLWELLTFLALIDPNISSKISAIKDLASLLQPSRTDNKP